MTKNDMAVKDGLVVGLEYVLRLDDGELIVTSEGGETVEYLHGYGQMVPGLEQALYGMTVGDEKHVVVDPQEGFGQVNPEAIEQVPQEIFPSDLELAPGMRLKLRDQSGNVLSAVVVEVGADDVVLDFNHQLAGETLHFDVKVTSVRKATSEELAEAESIDLDT